MSLDRVVAVIVETLLAEGRVWVCGNGGSEACGQHFEAELVVGMCFRHPALDVHAITLAGPVGSASINDIDKDDCYAHRVSTFVHPEDVLLVLTTSGRSENIRRALRANRGTAIALTGPLGIVEPYPDSPSWIEVRSDGDTATVQETHMKQLHEIARRVEEAMCPR